MGHPGIWSLTIALSLAASPARSLPSSHPRSSADTQPPFLHYVLIVDSSDLAGYTVTIRIDHAPHRFRLAMATHHEYDDRFWRYVTAFSAQAPATFTKEDSAVWAISTTEQTALINYRIHLPPPPPLHFSHRPFLNRYGGLVGDLHSFMYLVDNIHARCTLKLNLPKGWEAASGLDSVATALQLLDAPILIGQLHRWTFSTGTTPHEVVYLPASSNIDFDTAALVSNIQKIVRATANIFGSFPYRHYSFLLEDKSAGALEHGSSVTIGVQANDLASAHPDIYQQIAHEFFHTWNLMHIRPSPYTALNYGPQQQSPGLWFSEGVTMLYADLICRRAGLPAGDSTRIAHLTSLITRYYRDTGNVVLLPAKVSLVSNLQPGPLGDYSASTHLQGELFGTCLDILIRDATDGSRSLDDVMRDLYRRFSDKQPIRDSDIEQAVTTACDCSEAHAFFRDHLADSKPIDFSHWLGRLGLHFQHDQVPAADRQGHLLPDTRIYSWILRDDTSVRIGITNPNTCWAAAGLHTGDIIVGINKHPIHSRQEFQSAINTLSVGDIVPTDAIKASLRSRTPVIDTIHYLVYIKSYTKPVITISQDSAATPRQRRLLGQWVYSK